MKTLLAAIILGAALLTLPITANATTPAQADTATCQALTTYLHHQTPANADRVYQASRGADYFLKVDTAGWHWVRTHHRPLRVLLTWRGYVEYDCATLDGYGL